MHVGTKSESVMVSPLWDQTSGQQGKKLLRSGQVNIISMACPALSTENVGSCGYSMERESKPA